MWSCDGSGDEESEPFLVNFFNEDETRGTSSPRGTQSSIEPGAGSQQVGSGPVDNAQMTLTVVESSEHRDDGLVSAEEEIPLSAGQKQLHVAVRERDLNQLQLLLESPHDVDAVDSSGKSALFFAVDCKWDDGVRLLINARADVRTRYVRANDKTVLQMAVKGDNADITKLIVDAARKYEVYAEIVNVLNNDGMSPLFVAITRGNVEIVKTLLAAGADVTLLDNKKRNVAHMINKNSKQILNLISEHHADKLKTLVGQRSGDQRQTTPLHSAILRGDIQAVQFLHTKFPESLNDVAYISDDSNSCVEANVLHLVSQSARSDVLKHFVTALSEKTSDFQAQIDGITDKGYTPLHFALVRRQVDFAMALISAGADLSAEFEDKNGETRSAIDVFIHQVPASVEKLTKIFDESVERTKRKTTVTVDYEVLWSGEGTDNSFKVLAALQETGDKLGQEALFEHPLVESYLHLHWKQIQGPYTVLVVINIMFSISLSLLILFNLLSIQLGAEIVKWPMIFFGFLLAIHELECIGKKQPLKYRAEFLMKCVCYILAGCIFFPSLPQELSAFAVLLSWFELLLLISRIPNTGYYMLFFIEIAIKYLKLLASFFFLIIGFVIAFMVISRLAPPFDKIIPSTMKTVVMMAGEFDYENMARALMKPGVNQPIASQIAATVVFALFVVFIGLVLNNLFVAVAVIDVSKLRVISKRTGFLAVYSKFLLARRCKLYPSGVMLMQFRFLCAVVRLFNRKLVEHWETFRNIERKYDIGVLLETRTLKFPRELNTAIISRGYKSREDFKNKCREEKEAADNKKTRAQDRNQLLEAINKINSEITGLKQSLSEAFNSRRQDVNDL